MPDLDGLAALPLLLEKKRDLIVIMASTLTRRNAEISLKALVARRRRLHSEARDQPRGHHVGELPARPDRKDPPARRAAQARRRRAPRARADRRPVRAGAPLRAEARASPSRARVRACFRALSRHQAAAVLDRSPPRVLLIGSSTGGPQALTGLVEQHRAGARPRAGADHAAHAADLHDHSGRASGARERPARRMRRSTASRSCRARSISRPAAAT